MKWNLNKDQLHLLPQKPHIEVADSKTSAVFSDENRLAAGISTNGLQSKRLSVAQRKRLIRERKMKEGTWNVEKPPKKTPPSQDKGTAGSSEGVKNPTQTRVHHPCKAAT